MFLQELTEARSVASEITSRGAALFDLLAQEVELRERRRVGVSRIEMMDAGDVHRALVEHTAMVQEQSAQVRAKMDNIASDEVNLASKIDKKKMELTRHEKRLQSLQNVRYVGRQPLFSCCVHHTFAQPSVHG
jgi:clusterin-associated protein 1